MLLGLFCVLTLSNKDTAVSVVQPMQRVASPQTSSDSRNGVPPLRTHIPVAASPPTMSQASCRAKLLPSGLDVEDATHSHRFLKALSSSIGRWRLGCQSCKRLRHNLPALGTSILEGISTLTVIRTIWKARERVVVTGSSGRWNCRRALRLHR